MGEYRLTAAAISFVADLPWESVVRTLPMSVCPSVSLSVVCHMVILKTLEDYLQIGTADSVAALRSFPDAPWGRATAPVWRKHGCRPAFYRSAGALVSFNL